MDFKLLTPQQQALAIEMMLQYRLTLSYPFACIWAQAQDIDYAINEMGYDPTCHFTFGLVEDSVIVNIKDN